MKTLIFLLASTFLVGCCQNPKNQNSQKPLYEIGDVVCLKPDSLRVVIMTVYYSGNGYYDPPMYSVAIQNGFRELDKSVHQYEIICKVEMPK